MSMKRALCLLSLSLLSAGFAAAGDPPSKNPWNGQSGKWTQWHRFQVGGSSTYVYCYYTDCSGPADRQGTVFQDRKNRAALYYLRITRTEGNTAKVDATPSPYSLAFDGKDLYAVQKVSGKEKRLRTVYAGFSGATDVVVTIRPPSAKPQAGKPQGGKPQGGKPRSEKPQTQKPPDGGQAQHPAAPKPEETPAAPQGDALAAKLGKYFADPVERAVAEHVVLTSKGGADAFLKADENAAKAAAAEIAPKILGLVEGRLRRSSAPGQQGLSKVLAMRGVTERALVAYYCERTPSPTAAAPAEAARPPAKQQLETMSQRSQKAGSSGSDETRKELAQVETRAGDPLIGVCEDYFAQKKKQELEQGGGGGTTPSLTAKVPPVTGDKKPDPKDEKKKGLDLPWEKMAIGAIGGAIVFGALAWAAGGPFGIIALLGALAMAAVTWYINK